MKISFVRPLFFRLSLKSGQKSLFYKLKVGGPCYIKFYQPGETADAENTAVNRTDKQVYSRAYTDSLNVTAKHAPESVLVPLEFNEFGVLCAVQKAAASSD